MILDLNSILTSAKKSRWLQGVVITERLFVHHHKYSISFIINTLRLASAVGGGERKMPVTTSEISRQNGGREAALGRRGGSEVFVVA